MDKFMKGLSVLAIAFIVAIVLGAVMAFPVMWMWNYAAVDVLHLQEIDFPHAWGLLVLCSLLFKTSVSTSSEQK